MKLRQDLSNCSSATPQTDSRRLALVFWACIGVNLFGSIFASIEARGLYSDGAAYLVGIYKDRWFLLFDTRTVVQVLRQAPVVFASRYTQASLFECGQLFSLVMLTLPWVFCVLCWLVLPKTQKQWIVFPLLAMLAGFMATSVHAIGEAAIATSYEWLLLLLVMFRAQSIAWLLLWIALLFPAFRLQEGTFMFLAAIAVIAILSFRSASTRLERGLLGLGILILIGTIADQVWWVIYPQFPLDRDAIAGGFFRGEFLYCDGHFNLQLINGGAALFLLLALAAAWDRDAKTVSHILVGAWVLFCVGSIIAATMVEQSFAPFAQLQARYHPPIVSTILASIMVVLARSESTNRFLVSLPVLSVIALLCTIQLVADVAATERWNAFVADLRIRLTNSHGLIPWATTLHTGDSQADRNWQLLQVGWVAPYFSVVYAPEGTVRAIINAPPETPQLPFNPAEINDLPTLKGIDYAPYVRSVIERTRDGR